MSAITLFAALAATAVVGIIVAHTIGNRTMKALALAFALASTGMIGVAHATNCQQICTPMFGGGYTCQTRCW